MKWKIEKGLLGIFLIFLRISSSLSKTLAHKTGQPGEEKEARGLLSTVDHMIEGKSSRFFGGFPSWANQNSGFFPSPYGGYNFGGFSSYPYPSPSLNGYNPGSYGGFYPGLNPSFYGNSFGGYSQQQQQQQQQISQIGGGTSGIGGFQPTFPG